MRTSIPAKQKKRGRPATGFDPLVAVRLPPELTARIDAWAKAQGTSRSDAMRRLLEQALSAAPAPCAESRNAKSARSPAEQELDEALASSFPASDPIEMEEPSPRRSRVNSQKIK